MKVFKLLLVSITYLLIGVLEANRIKNLKYNDA